MSALFLASLVPVVLLIVGVSAALRLFVWMSR